MNNRLAPPPAIASRGSTITSPISFSPACLSDQLKINSKVFRRQLLSKLPPLESERLDYSNDIAVLTGHITFIRDDMGLTLEKVGKEVLGSAVKVVIGKDSTLVVTDGSTQRAVEKQVAQWKRSLEEYSEEKFKKKILNGWHKAG
ncbi:unnamed protein product [Musa acuminata subsp. malaccensis]|uniref:(wild Malaysian banana) hypothetical protein n=1 Tax=Musa acuminata subsp. malaccensis TaxID=214687 RepID=A0A804L4R0_MUSAM|nr:unnamed protein product [Musa acuminata subsp. malaccensis]